MKYLFSIILGFWAFSSQSQVTTEPAIPVDNQSLKIIFDATEGTAGLKDYTGDVYAHTGVITDKSTSNSDWKYVIAEWTENIDKAKLTRTADNIYELEISPDIRSFYGVTEGDQIKQMAFVFRSADRTREGKADGGKDIFVAVFEEGLTVSFIKPADKTIIEKNEPLSIEISSTIATNLELRLNNEIVKQNISNNLSHSLTLGKAGEYWLYAIATQNQTIAKDSTYIVVRDDIVMENLPDGINKGVNYLSDETLTLCLFAPEKEHVFVLGDFNNWLPDNAYQMKKDGDYFWLTIENLEAGKAYIYQYLIDGSIKIADPYTDQTSDPWNDQYINSTIYPNLPAYPLEKTDGIASVFQTGQEIFEWEITNFQIPEKDKLIIYELLIRDFNTEHSFQSVMNRLDYLEDLNINVLELMPVNEFEGNSSWGYNPSFYFAPDKYYGSKNDLKKLIDECHKRGIAVVIDMVLNHSYGQSPLVQLYWDNENNRPAANNPWYNTQSNFQNPDAQWGYDFNHESEFTRELVDSINSYWMSEYQIDGFRFDFTKGFSNTIYGTTSWGSAYDISRIANLKRMADEIWNRNEDALIIFEHLSDNSEEKELADYGILLWGNLNHNYAEAAMGYTENSKSDLSWGVYQQRNWNEPNLVTYMESHDEERLTYKLQQFGNSNLDYNTKDLQTALNRMELNSVFFIPLPGPKMIWQFGEIGYDFSINYNGRLGEKPIKWEYLDIEDRTDVFQVVSKLNYLKQTYEEFQNPELTYNLTGEIKSYQLKQGDNYVIVIGNFGVSENLVTIDFPTLGPWYDFFDEITFTVNSTETQLTLAPGEYSLFSNRQFNQPKIVTSLFETNNQNNIKIYPNPAAEHIWIESNDPIIMVSIYSLDGSIIKQYYFTKTMNKKIDLNGLQCGFYVLSVQTQEKIQSISLIKK